MHHTMKSIFLIGMILLGPLVWGQTPQDSLPSWPDTAKRSGAPPVLSAGADTVAAEPLSSIHTRRDTLYTRSDRFLADSFLYTGHPYFGFTHPTRYTISVRQWQGKEAIFYAVIGLLILFALIKNGFYRYIQDLTKIFFRTSMRQRQLKEQLVQSPLPSLMLNVFFLLSIGMFLALLLQHFQWGMQFNFWLLYLYCILGLIAIYGGKFLVLKFIGWTLQVSEASDAYIFIVFSANKILGMVLLPFSILLAFSYGTLSQVAVLSSIAVIIALFAYRYFLSYVSIHRQIRISFFHFLIYLCAFEIVPLLLINKLLFRFLS